MCLAYILWETGHWDEAEALERQILASPDTPAGVRAAAASGVALALLLFAYAARLMAAAVEPVDSGLARVTPSMDRAARSLGQTEAGALRRVHAPLALRS